MQGQDEVAIAATQPPTYTVGDSGEGTLRLPANAPITFSLTSAGWRVGNAVLGNGDLVIRPAAVGSVRVGGTAYRGQYRLVPVGGKKFDVVNEVDLDDYLKGVLPIELYPKWAEETYKAQAVAARTYALYEKHSATAPRHWDVYADTRSQAYGGIDAETSKSRQAVEDTSGIVLTYGPQGEERIFKAYFSSCCGGVTQSSMDVFAEPFIQPLSAQNVGTLCSASTKFNWPPVVLAKAELTRRIKLWAAARGRSEKDMALVRSAEIVARNVYGRPIRFQVIDVSGHRYSFSAEDFRTAVNTDAGGTSLPSSYVENILNDADRVRFVGGHGYGHGVGLCQWCAEARARVGMRHEDILMAAYPGARLLRAY
jgi:stage II sporulation protein D